MTKALTRRVALAFALLIAAMSAARAADIAVGLAIPLSGPRQALGRAIETTMIDAVDTLNRAGGVLGARVALDVVDDGCETTTAEGAARTLAAHKPAVVIGHPCSGAAVAAAAIYAQNGIVFIATGPRHPAVTAKRVPPTQAIFRLAGRDDRQGEAAADWLLKTAPEKRVAIVHDRTGYAREIVDGARQRLAIAGTANVPVLTIIAGKRDYPEIADALKQQRIEAVLFAGYPDEAIVILDDMRRSNIAIPLLGTDSLATAAFSQRAADSEANVEILLPLIDFGTGPNTAAEATAELAKVALEIWSEAARRAATHDANAVAAALRDGTFTTRRLGTISFDTDGDARMPSYAPARPTNGAWVREGN